jgi:arylsulfatase A-like enzyme
MSGSDGEPRQAVVRPGQPNILFITLDQWRADCIGALGHPVVRTPAIDGLTRRGVTFLRHFAGAAPCSPARACLYTGLHQETNRVVRNGTPLDARHLTLAQALRAHGYDPTLFGYTDIAADPRRFAERDPALRTYEGILPGMSVGVALPEHLGPWAAWLKSRGHAIPNPRTDLWLPRDRASAFGFGAPIWSAEETQAAFLVDALIGWIDTQPAGWCAHLSLLAPHPPWILPDPYRTLYHRDDGPDFVRARDWDSEWQGHPFAAVADGMLKAAKFIPGTTGSTRDWSEAEARQARALYWGLVSEADAQLGRLFATLDQLGLSDQTLIVLTADHAEQAGDHFLWGKLGFYDQSYAIPLIIAAPWWPAPHGERVNAFTEAVDVMPTLLDLIGGKAIDHLDGVSLAGYCDGVSPTSAKTAARWSFDFRFSPGAPAPHDVAMEDASLSVLRTATAKYVHSPSMPPLMFDLANDPQERINVAADPAYRDLRLEMAEALLAQRSRHLDRRLTGITLEPTEGAVTRRRRPSNTMPRA